MPFVLNAKIALAVRTPRELTAGFRGPLCSRVGTGREGEVYEGRKDREIGPFFTNFHTWCALFADSL